MSKISVFITKRKCQAEEQWIKHWSGQRFLKEFKATCKSSAESELKEQKTDLKSHLGRLCSQPFNND